MTKGSFRTAVLVADGIGLALALVVAWRLQGSAGLTAAAVGNLAGLANLAALAWLLGKLSTATSQGSKVAYGALLAGKLALFVGVLALLLWGLQLEPLGLLIGFSAVVLALFAGSAVAAIDVNNRETTLTAPKTGPVEESSAR